MNIKTELPTEPGAYWWMESTAREEWEVVIVKRLGLGLVVFPMNDDDCGGRSCLVSEWSLAYSIGFWARIPNPDEAANDPVRIAAKAMLEAFENADPNWTESVSDLEDALEATK